MAATDVLFLCRALVVFYFLFAAVQNIKNYTFLLGMFQGVGVAGGKLLLPIGILAQMVGSVLFLYAPTVVVGAAILCVFVLAADAMFHRFWTYPNPQERTIHMHFLVEHVAVMAGIVGLAVNR